MNIGNRIKQLRKMEMLTQQEFAERLGVERSYISHLEKNKHHPSEQLILSICREFGVRNEWLRVGEGEMYEKRGFLPKGFSLIEAIYDRLTSPERPIPLNTIAKILEINPENTKQKLKLHKDFHGALWLLLELFEEGDRRKIDAVMAQLKALKPFKEEKEAELEKAKKGA